MSDDFFPFSGHDSHDKQRYDHDSHHNRSNHDHDDHDRHDHDRYGSDRRHRGHDGFDMDRLMPIIEKVLHNKTLLVLIGVGALAVLAAGVALAIVFFPVLVRIVDSVFGGGLKGLLAVIQSVLGVIGVGEGN